MNNRFATTVFLASLVPVAAASAQLQHRARPSKLSPDIVAQLRKSPKARIAATLYSKAARTTAFRKPRAIPATPVGRPGPTAAGSETETNDSAAWADPVVMNAMTGRIDVGDEDTYRIDTPDDGQLTVSVAADGTTPMTDPAILITDSFGQFVAFNDDASSSNLFPSATLLLPKGRFFVHVFGVIGDTGGYRLTTSHAKQTFRLIPPNFTLTERTTVPGREVGLRVVIPTDSKVTITSNDTTNGDLYASLMSTTGSVLYFNDDSSTSGLNPSIDTHLPAGIYLLTFATFGPSVGAFTCRVGTTSSKAPTLACTGSSSGTIAGDETLAMYQFKTTSPETITLTAGPGTSNALSDPLLRLYDSNLRVIFLQDDTTTSLYPQMSIQLPAGSYYVSVQGVGFTPRSGTFTLQRTCARAAAIPPISLGSNPRSLVNGNQTAMFQLTTRASAPIQFEVDTSLATLPDPSLAILDANGKVVSSNDDISTLDSRTGTASLPAGTYFALVREYNNSAGTFDLRLRAPLYLADVARDRRITFSGKAGHTLVTAVGATALPVGVEVRPFGGRLFLTPQLLLAPIVLPTTGRVTGPTVPNGLTVFLQALSIRGPADGDFTHLIKG